jgi:hypothetical protein
MEKSLVIDGHVITEGPVVNHTRRGYKAITTLFDTNKAKVIKGLEEYISDSRYVFDYFTVDDLHVVRVTKSFDIKFTHTDNGFCRCHYKTPQYPVCIQLYLDGVYKQYRCTKDGEPSYELTGKEFIDWDLFPLPDCHTTTGKEVVEWLLTDGGK